jgi:hypothetical protein
LKHILHPGENTLAVSIVNGGQTVGITEGETLENPFHPVTPHRAGQRVNGLAPVIVPPTPGLGEIKLPTTAKGLSPMKPRSNQQFLNPLGLWAAPTADYEANRPELIK